MMGSEKKPWPPASPQTQLISRETTIVRAFAIVGLAYVLSSIATNWRTYSRSLDTLSQTPVDIFPDTDYPLRKAIEPWNISNSYPYPRQLIKNVSEGTWLRIATHPSKDEIVFDMLGDLYCMSTNDTIRGPAKAHAFLQGIPYDKEAEFSADGSQLVFISDSGFGVDNIWTLPYTSCEDMATRPSSTTRSFAIQQTNSTFRFLSSPSFHPTLPKLLATKWYLTGRPNGAGEAWEFPLLTENTSTLPERGGRRLISRKLPASWPVERYIESQLGVEQSRYIGEKGDGIIFTRNIRDDNAGKFSYNKDVHKGINAIFILNTTTGVTSQLVDASPGGANMPRVSHDGRTLAFVRRVKEKSALVLKDLRSGTLHHVWNELTYDVSLIPAFMGAYPNYGFASDDSHIMIWSSGKIYKVPLRVNELGERTAAAPAPSEVPFIAKINLSLGETRYSETNISATELKDEGRVYSLRGLRSSWTGKNVAFEAAGDTYILDVEKKLKKAIPKSDPGSQYYGPSFIHETPFVLHARWSDLNLTILELVDMTLQEQVRVDGMPRGRYLSPIIHESKIAFVRTGKDYMLGDVEETADEGVWIGDIELPASAAAGNPAIVRNLVLLVGTKATQDMKLNFKSSSQGLVLLIQDSTTVLQYNVITASRELVSSGKTSVEMVLSNSVPSTRSRIMSLISKAFPFVVSRQFVAFRDFQHVWITQRQEHSAFDICSKPELAPSGLMRLSEDGGHDIAFSTDGTKLFWLFGPYLKHVSLEEVFSKCDAASSFSRDTGACVAPLVDTQEIVATYETDLSKMYGESKKTPVALINGTIISMDPSLPQIIEHGTVVIHRGIIIAIGSETETVVPENAHVVQLSGGAVLPGFVDIHGHWGGFLSQYPSVSWELETFLGYGVTTIHNPSSKNVGGFVERALVEKGAFYGPRIYHTGDVLYGSTQTNVYTEINSNNDARAALQRVKIEGGDSSFSVKNYQLPSRSARQRLLLEATKLKMLIVPEGGWSLDWDMTYFIDGMTTLEHPVPIPELFEDVLSLIEASGSSYTQIAVMNYGGLFGQNWVHQNNDIPEDFKLRKYIKHDILEALIEVKKAPDHSYQFFNTSISAKKLADRGVRTNIGAHGEQPIGFLFHSEMKIYEMGGQSPYQVLKAATLDGAISLGLQSSIGSIEKGKLSDLVIYPAGIDTVEKVWENSMHMKHVVCRGRIFGVENGLVEEWPRKGRRQNRGRINPEE